MDPALVAGLALVIVALLATLRARRAWLASPGGKAVGFLAFCALPGIFLALGASAHFETSKRTEFCLSCHPMEAYGKSLRVDDSELLAAAHYQNRRIDRANACYSCHTTYTMFGDVQAKISGFRHVWKYYVAGYPEKLELARPYNNRECLHCHAGARSYEESDAHVDDLADMASGKTSCLECHADIHAIEELENAKLWEETR